MKNMFHHVKRHAKTVGQHVKKHHKKYLFGIFGGFAITKMLIFFVAGVGVFNYTHSTFADQETGCVMTGQTYVEESQVCTFVPGYYTGGTEECVTTIEGYYTGGSLDESGNLIDQVYVDPVQSCTLTGQTYVAATSPCVSMPGYWTGGTLLCPVEESTGDLLTGNNGEDQTGGFVHLESQETTGTDGICTADDIAWLSPVSGALLRGTSSFVWEYLTTDCTSTGHTQLLTLQLYDHNHQRISLTTISSLASGYTFDTLLLSGYTNTSGLVTSGMYTVTGTSGVVLYTGVATGVYTSSATGYQIRLLDSQGIVLTTGNIFTIDNSAPTFTGVTLTSTDAVSGIVGLSDQVLLTFTASETLSGQIVLIGGTGATLVTQSGLTYTYGQVLNSGFAQGILTYALAYADLAGNTGLVVGTGDLSFDKTAPVISGMTLTGTIGSGLTLSFVTSELARIAINYTTTGSAVTSWTGTTYQTGQVYTFTGIQVARGYVFRLQVEDLVGNTVVYSGSFSVNASGVISFGYTVYQPVFSTGTLIELKDTLKNEINKFNACKSGIVYKPVSLNINKNDFTLQLPDFQKSDVKKVVNAFTLLVMDKVEENKKLSKAEVEEITQKFDNFLVILKLLRDDDNTCKQNLSNYHISQFEHTLNEYNLYFK